MVDRCEETLIGGFGVAEGVLIHKADIANVDYVLDGKVLKKFGSLGEFLFFMKETWFFDSLTLFVFAFGLFGVLMRMEVIDLHGCLFIKNK
jgi:hypothetical protein